jgi:chemotaxis family two-component system response regulator Rcp1
MTTSLSNIRPAEILLVEDNEDDIILAQESFRVAKLEANLHTVGNGQECLTFLRHQPPYEDAPKVDLVLLDLNMPVMDGREAMTAISRDETLKHMPVVVLTTSAAESDIFELYKLRCNSYIVKPVKFERFVEIVRKLGVYWLAFVSLPNGSEEAAAKPDEFFSFSKAREHLPA